MKRTVCYAFFEDITPEKDSFDQLQMVAESIGSSISVILLKQDGQELLYANKTFFQWVDEDQESYDSDILRYNMSFVLDEDREAMADAINNSIRTGTPQEVRYRFLRPGEPMRWMSRRLTAIKRAESETYLSFLL